MLSAIVAVTLLVPDVEVVERAYQQSLDYQTVERGHVAADQAESWGAEALAGREFVVLQPSSREPVYLRMIETDASTGPGPESARLDRDRDSRRGPGTTRGQAEGLAVSRDRTAGAARFQPRRGRDAGARAGR